jgi:hypothetical protein
MSTVAFIAVLAGLWLAYRLGAKARVAVSGKKPEHPPTGLPTPDDVPANAAARVTNGNLGTLAFPPRFSEGRSLPGIRRQENERGDVFWLFSIDELSAYWRDPVPEGLNGYEGWLADKALQALKQQLSSRDPKVGAPENAHVALLVAMGGILPHAKPESGVITCEGVSLGISPTPGSKVLLIFGPVKTDAPP